MKSLRCDMFGIDVPIFAFSHCRDVVVEVSKAGGMGVLGMARMSPDQVEADLGLTSISTASRMASMC
jgi:hypothetical protein